MISNFLIQVNYHKGYCYKFKPWAAQVLDLVEKYPFLDRLQHMESNIQLNKIGVGKIS